MTTVLLAAGALGLTISCSKESTSVAPKRGTAVGPVDVQTTMMLVVSMIPIAVGKGPGSAGRAAMAKVIIGGQMLCLLVTLVVTPVTYSLFDDWAKGRFWRRRQKRGAQAGGRGSLAQGDVNGPGLKGPLQRKAPLRGGLPGFQGALPEK